MEGSGSRRTSDPQSRAAAQAKTSLHARSHMLADDAAKRQLLSDDENRDSMVDGQRDLAASSSQTSKMQNNL